MNDHRMPRNRRKDAKSPPLNRHEPNEFAIGKARIRKLVASLERCGHQTIISQCRLLKRMTILTRAQTDEVDKEINFRRGLVADMTRIVENSQRAIDLQLAKPGTPANIERITPPIPGPVGQRAKVKVTTEQPTSSVHLTEGGSVHLIAGHNARRPKVVIDLAVKSSSWFPPAPLPIDKDEKVQNCTHP